MGHFSRRTAAGGAIGAQQYWRAIDWLKGQTGRESGWSYRLRQRLAGNSDKFPDGWPWFPGAAAWVIPTSLGIMAFEMALKQRDDSALRERVEGGREYLFSRMCADGGWNHGSSKALGRDGDSYPETTGIALLALGGAGPRAELEKARAAARRHLAVCRSAEGVAWLRMALGSSGGEPVCRSVMDSALMALASSGRGLV